MTRVAETPPELVGFTHVELIGTGGYAEVFLYEQHMPTRQVAVKVLKPSAVAGDAKRAAFAAEANLMARVSAHPFIVQVFQAAIAPDGRPYLVMEYYPGKNYYARARTEQMAVAEVLRTGVQLASAVETAHRAGILHRDIKPANVLTSAYSQPGLTDFGIASASDKASEATDGLSIPWSPPESFGDAAVDARADVYSLAATLYDLLCGRSPFEIPGGDNSHLALMGRIERQPVPPTHRPDVPVSLERLLAHAMDKNLAHRPASAADFGRALQAVESELKLAVTALQLADEHRAVRSRADVVDDDSTRVKGVVELEAQATPSSAMIAAVPANPVGYVAPAVPRRREGLLAEPEVGDTVQRAPAAQNAAPLARRAPRKGLLIGAGAAAMAVVAVIGVSAATGGGSSPTRTTLAEAEVNDGVPSASATVEPVASFEGTAVGDGTFRFTWEAPAGTGLTYAVSEVGNTAPPTRVTDTSYVARATCIEVETIASSGVVSAPVRGCAV